MLAPEGGGGWIYGRDVRTVNMIGFAYSIVQKKTEIPPLYQSNYFFNPTLIFLDKTLLLHRVLFWQFAQNLKS